MFTPLFIKFYKYSFDIIIIIIITVISIIENIIEGIFRIEGEHVILVVSNVFIRYMLYNCLYTYFTAIFHYSLYRRTRK